MVLEYQHGGTDKGIGRLKRLYREGFQFEVDKEKSSVEPNVLRMIHCCYDAYIPYFINLVLLVCSSNIVYPHNIAEFNVYL